MEEVLKKIYLNLESTSSIGSVRKFFEKAKKIDPNISLKKVRDFLKKQPGYTLHVVKNKRFRRRRFLVRKPGDITFSDVLYIYTLVKSKKYKYILVFIDGYSRFMHAYAMENLKSKTVVPVLDHFFSNSVYAIPKLGSDAGQEFCSREAQKFFEKMNIERYSTFDRDIKMSIVERSNLTLRKIFSRYITNFGTSNFFKDLSTMVESYNHETNRGLLNKKPIDLYLETNWGNIKKHTLHSINTAFPNKKKLMKPKFHLGEVVRVTLTKSRFARSFHVQNSRELFIVNKVNLNHLPVTYGLKSIDGEPISGIFYDKQLIKTLHDGYFSVKVIKRRKKGTEFFIKYIDYPSKPGEWIKKRDLKKI